VNKFNIITIFPDMFNSPFSLGVISKAIEKKLIDMNVVNMRDYTIDKHKVTDDYPYGGGAGLVMKPEPICRAVDNIKSNGKTHVVLLDPRGAKFSHKIAKRISLEKNVTFICGRYEGIDERIRDLVADEEISVGDFILTGGEFAAMMVIDAVSRFIPGVLGDALSNVDESFEFDALEYPHYTRPASYRGISVPEVLLSGHHAAIDEWRKKKSAEITLQKRKDLVGNMVLQERYKNILSEVKNNHITKVNINVVLLHYPMYDKDRNIVSTAITNMDLHDISRTCKTYGVRRYYVVTPLKAQRSIAERIIKHWKDGEGGSYNLNRKKAFESCEVRESFLDVISEIERTYNCKPKIVGTTARKGKTNISYDEIMDMVVDEPVILVFGTGWGLTDDFFNITDYVLPPINGVSDFNHLSVRSAVAITLDRMFRTYDF